MTFKKNFYEKFFFLIMFLKVIFHLFFKKKLNKILMKSKISKKCLKFFYRKKNKYSCGKNIFFEKIQILNKGNKEL